MVDSYVAAAGAAAHDVSAVTVLAVSSHFDRCTSSWYLEEKITRANY